MKAFVGYRQCRVWRDDVDVIGLRQLASDRCGYRNTYRPCQDLRQPALVVRIEMLNDDTRQASAGRKRAEQLADGIKTTC
jgi:hypothetical protein